MNTVQPASVKQDTTPFTQRERRATDNNYTRTWAGNNAEIHHVDLDSNINIRYLKMGSGKPLLLLHTMRTQLDYFKNIIPALAETYTVYALDLPGHGYSSMSASEYSEPYFRKSVKTFIETLNLNDLTLAGESIGAVLALTVASEIGDRIKQVYAFNPYDYGEKFGGGIRRSSIWGNLIIGSFGVPVIGVISSHMENRILLRKVLSGGLVDKTNLNHDMLLEFNRVGRQRGYRRVERSTFANWKSWLIARSHYTKISSPVSLIYGQHDWSTQEERSANASLIPQAKVITLDNSGHFSSLDEPDRVIDIIRADSRR